MRTRGSFLVAATVCFVISLMLPTAVSGAPNDVSGPVTTVVDDDGAASPDNCDGSSDAYQSLADAIAAVVEDGTVVVCPGTYAECGPPIRKRVKIRGPHTGIDPRETTAPGAVVTCPEGLQVAKPGVVIDGMEFEGVTGAPALSTGPIEVVNSVFRGNCVGVHLRGGNAASRSPSRTTIRRNVFVANNAPCPLSGQGIYADGCQSNVFVEENQFAEHTSADIRVHPHGCQAETVEIRRNQGDRGMCLGRLVHSVVADNALGPQALPPRGERKGVLAQAATATPPGARALQSPLGLRRVVRAAGSGRSAEVPLVWAGLRLRAGTRVGAPDQIDPSAGAPLWGVHLSGGATDVWVTGNTLVGNVHGVLLDQEKGAAPNTGVVLERNCIAGNTTTGLRIHPGMHEGGLKAEQNWWGAVDGPVGGTRSGGGDMIMDPDNVVDAEPFLLASTGQGCPMRAVTRTHGATPTSAPGPLHPEAPQGGVAAGGGGAADGAEHGGPWWRGPLAVITVVALASTVLVLRTLRVRRLRRGRYA